MALHFCLALYLDLLLGIACSDNSSAYKNKCLLIYQNDITALIAINSVYLLKGLLPFPQETVSCKRLCCPL